MGNKEIQKELGRRAKFYRSEKCSLTEPNLEAVGMRWGRLTAAAGVGGSERGRKQIGTHWQMEHHQIETA